MYSFNYSIPVALNNEFGLASSSNTEINLQENIQISTLIENNVQSQKLEDYNDDSGIYVYHYYISKISTLNDNILHFYKSRSYR